MKELPLPLQANIVAAAQSATRVSGLTHNFYKYPARFSPVFARAIIEAFTEPEDLVLDNHVGGGTTLVEAAALGRHAVGIDISSLAEFVSTVKTTIFSDDDLSVLKAWASSVAERINIHRPSRRLKQHANLGYYKHLDSPARWRLRKVIEQAIANGDRLPSLQLRQFSRCVVLRTAQWALDGRKVLPSVDAFRRKLTETGLEMIEGSRELRSATEQCGTSPKIKIVNRTSAGIEQDQDLWSANARPKLVLTSPPYPGVHVLYHRWQVDGRKEAPLPFMIADRLDGAASSYYTMGDRKHPGLATYFESIRRTMSSVAKVAERDTIVVQMVAFSEPEWQLAAYLVVMEEAGLTETFLPVLAGEFDGRLWRSVPSRRWYSEQRGPTPGSKEVVLFHRLAPRTHNVEVRPPLGASSEVLNTSAR